MIQHFAEHFAIAAKPQSIVPLAALAALLLLVGCGGPSTTPGGRQPDAAAAEETSPREVLQSMVDAYREAKSYADDAQVVMTYTENGRPLEERVRQSLTFVRPDRVSFLVEQEAFRAHIVSDGERFVAKVTDAETDDMAGQVVVREAPAELKVADFTSDPTLFDYINGALVFPTQLELLLSDKALPAALGEGVERRMLDDAVIDGRECYRVEVGAVAGQPAQGKFVFSIDKQNSLLRRLDYPREQLQGTFPPQYKNLALRVDYNGARFDVEAPPSTFQIEVPDEALQVNQFVVPPPVSPLAADAYGKRPAAFKFTDAKGEEVSQEDLLGRAAVLLWVVDNPGSQEAVHQFARLRQAQGETSSAALYAVLPLLDENIAARADQLTARLGAEVPVLKDEGDYARDVFDLRGYPTLIVLDKDGKVQYAELGLNPQAELAQTLPPILERVAAGEDVASAEAARIRTAEAVYQQRLAEAMEAGPGTVHELPQVALLPASEPQRLTLTKLWSSDEVAEPGNILPVGEGDATQLLVVSGRGDVAQLDAAGKVAARHTLELPPDSVISYLRSKTDKQGKRWYAASARMGPQLFLFDAAWKRTASYPPAGEQQQGVRDVQLADLADNGKLQALVAFWGLAGVHAIDLEGNRVWGNRTFPTALSLAVTPPNEVGWRKLLVTGEVGEILELNQFGRHVPPYRVDNLPIYYLYAAAYNQAQTPFCGITVDVDGRPSAVGLAEGPQQRLVQRWTHPLPKGIMPNQIEAVTSGRLLPDTAGQWLLAGPDGSLHVVGDEGTFSDSWNTGLRLTGMAIAQLDGAPALILATAKGVTAWRVELKPAAGQELPGPVETPEPTPGE